MRHIFITGAIGIGKSTLLSRLLSLYPEKGIYGFYTKKEAVQPDGKSRVYIHSAQETERHYNDSNCIAISTADSLQVRPQVLETAGIRLLSDIPLKSLVVMDELGIFETEAPLFCNRVLLVLDGDCFVIGVVRDSDTPFLDTVRNHPEVALYRMTMENRDILYDRIRYDIENSRS
ncbi:MAG: nucleoside-triphosphatase [Saccharofermentanales bacterium]